MSALPSEIKEKLALMSQSEREELLRELLDPFTEIKFLSADKTIVYKVK